MTTRSGADSHLLRAVRGLGLTLAECAWLVVGLVWLITLLVGEQVVDGLGARRP